MPLSTLFQKSLAIRQLQKESHASPKRGIRGTGHDSHGGGPLVIRINCPTTRQVRNWESFGDSNKLTYDLLSPVRDVSTEE
jgi:hypothetical protein